MALAAGEFLGHFGGFLGGFSCPVGPFFFGFSRFFGCCRGVSLLVGGARLFFGGFLRGSKKTIQSLHSRSKKTNAKTQSTTKREKITKK